MENLKPRSQKPSKAKKKPIKVTYISNPMRVQANNESEFRAIVQELTGKNSTIDSYLEDEVQEFPNNGVYRAHETSQKRDEQVLSSVKSSLENNIESSLWMELYGYQSHCLHG
ncbi:uncharacterized protein LOC124943687 [Impatiens glandulifera]|uniref:uncharacterized protein LOC124943687 n=1 Tax=Impatiens glandulifera TaxID=253017 RepID=UPI001FB08107|nr:uncharacterized protein LOC124943687 [Impatiens glandulifera]